jgi:hypothetical protein
MKHALAAWMTALTVAAGSCLAAVPAGATTYPAGPLTIAAKANSGTECSAAFFDGNPLLGPQRLPSSGPIAVIVRGYHRLAGLTESQFLATYWDPAANGGRGGWRYPPDNGFLILSGHPAEHRSTLLPGQRIDRFGSEYGGFLAPEDTPYADRSLPPQSLDGSDPAYTCNYHRYLVLKPFQAEAGPIAPGFGQPGQGLQYQLVSSLLPGDPATANVLWLIGHGYLQRQN